jgi:hypothetical protein
MTTGWSQIPNHYVPQTNIRYTRIILLWNRYARVSVVEVRHFQEHIHSQWEQDENLQHAFFIKDLEVMINPDFWDTLNRNLLFVLLGSWYTASKSNLSSDAECVFYLTNYFKLIMLH